MQCQMIIVIVFVFVMISEIIIFFKSIKQGNKIISFGT